MHPTGNRRPTWAIQLVGRGYYLSVVNDAFVEPRWRPDWVDARYLAADLYGRLAAAKVRMPADSVPGSWKEKLAKAEAWIVAERVAIASTYPAILQGAAPIPDEQLLSGTPVAQFYETFIREPTVNNFLVLAPIVWAWGFQLEARDAVLTVVKSLRSEATQENADADEHALGLAAWIASLSHDSELGDIVSQTCVERAAVFKRRDALFATVIAMLECSAANADRNQAMSTLARHLESLSFASPPNVLEELLQLLRTLRGLNGPLANLLGRAIATARLGRPLISS